MDFTNSSTKFDISQLQSLEEKGYSVTWQSPSNLALVKYWGKYGNQLPRNPSISFTLSKAHTETQLDLIPKVKERDALIDLEFVFEGHKNPSFEKRIKRLLEKLLPYFPFLSQVSLKISSTNSFPHSSGIASSASSMSALALCLCSVERDLFDTLHHENDFLRKASFVARLGSGSACRSVYPKLALWGEHSIVDHSSNLYAIPMAHKVDTVFKSFQNDILIVSSEKKEVSSSAGHKLMDGNDFAEPRYKQANSNLTEILSALEGGDLEKMGYFTELEALTLHALMMASNYMLIKPNSLEIMSRIRSYRKETNLPLFFSLDAGPNIHLLYPKSIQSKVQDFIHGRLIELCENNYVLSDAVGEGPIKINK